MSVTEHEGDLVTLAGESGGLHGHAGRPRALERGDVVGRYVVLERLGVGGMGEVYSAYDPELDRKIAIKLLLAHRHEPLADSLGPGRLLREAQAMAKLAHPNVVAVHDVGTHDGRVFVAMEFVDGGTLAEWMTSGRDGRGEPHPWPVVLARFVAAGEGLAAAHAAGLIHRDFKPANVLVGRDGSIRVADFGLARQAEIDSSVEPPVEPPSSEPSIKVDDATLPALASGRSIGSLTNKSSRSLASRMTATGATLGTPAYMAPEQYNHAPIDARADQFSFCVALWEALFGQRPFAGDNLHALMFAIAQGKLREPPAGSEVPAAIRKALVRGLAHDPQRRWPTMHALLAELRFDPLVRRRRLQLTIGGAALLAAIVGGVLFARTDPRDAEPVCAGAAAAFGDALSSARREAIASRFAGFEQQWAHDFGERLIPQLDGWADEWQAAWTDACEATHVRAEQSSELLDRRLSCLDRQRRGFVKLVDALGSADEALARKSNGLLAELGSIAACSDKEALLRITPMPADPELVRTIIAADEALSDVNGLYLAGQIDQAAAALEQQREIVAKLDYAPLAATFEALQGRIITFRGDPIGGEQALERAFALALRAGDDRRAALVARALAYELRERDRMSDASRWLMIALAIAERLDDDSLRGEIELTRSQILAATGDYRGAEAAAQLGHELFGRARPNSARVGDALYLMAVAAARDGRHDVAVERIEQARSIWSSTIGPRHPQSVGAIGLLGVAARSKGDYAAAERHFRAALEIQQDTYGVDHVEVTNYLVNLSIALADQGNFDEAIPLLERAIEIREASSRPSPAWIGRSHVNLAQLQRRAGRLEPAVVNLDRGEAILREALGDDHPDLITAIHIRGQLQLALGDLDRAEAALDEALRRATLELGPEHLGVFEVRTDAARLALARGQPRRAEEHLVGTAPADTSPIFIGEREFVHAQVHAALGREQDAQAAAIRARQAFEQDGPGSAKARAEVEAWLRARE